MGIIYDSSAHQPFQLSDTTQDLQTHTLGDLCVMAEESVC